MKIETAQAIINFMNGGIPSHGMLVRIRQAAISHAGNAKPSHDSIKSLVAHARAEVDRIVEQKATRKANKRMQSSKGHRGAKNRGMKASKRR